MHLKEITEIVLEIMFVISDKEFDPYETEVEKAPNVIDDVYENKINVEDFASDEPISIDLGPDDFAETEEEVEPEVIKEVEPVIEKEKEVPVDENEPFANYVFNPEIASEELGLTVDLVEEFIQDFIAQALRFKEELYTSAKNGDLDNVKIQSHKLKGVAANLRVEDALDTLTVINSSDDVAVIKTNLDRLYRMIEKLSNPDAVATPEIEEAQNDDEDEFVLSFKDGNLDSSSEPESSAEVENIDSKDDEISFADDIPVTEIEIDDSQVPDSINIPELEDDEFLNQDSNNVVENDISDEELSQVNVETISREMKSSIDKKKGKVVSTPSAPKEVDVEEIREEEVVLVSQKLASPRRSVVTLCRHSFFYSHMNRFGRNDLIIKRFAQMYTWIGHFNQPEHIVGTVLRKEIVPGVGIVDLPDMTHHLLHLLRIQIKVIFPHIPFFTVSVLFDLFIIRQQRIVPVISSY